MEYIIRFDGASKGNPGKASSAALLYCHNEIIDKISQKHSELLTNNQAEYIGCLLGIELAIKHQIKKVKIEGDSQLIIYQLCGKYKCKNDKLIVYHSKIKELIKSFETIEYQWIPRKLNKDADELCNNLF